MMFVDFLLHVVTLLLKKYIYYIDSVKKKTIGLIL